MLGPWSFLSITCRTSQQPWEMTCWSQAATKGQGHDLSQTAGSRTMAPLRCHHFTDEEVEGHRGHGIAGNTFFVYLLKTHLRQ